MHAHRYSILAFALCCLVLTDAFADSPSRSEASSKIARTRDDWLAAFKSGNVATTISFYAPNAAFLQPSGERIEGIQAIRELYENVVKTFQSDLVLHSRTLEVSDELAYDSGEYEETLTNRATTQEQHFVGQYVMIFRRRSDGSWKIVEHAWTVAPNPANHFPEPPLRAVH